jgi:mitogen-activated protein kinase kinase kinase
MGSSMINIDRAIMFHIGVATKHPPLPDTGQLSPQGIDFIRRCLIIDGLVRPTASDLQNHPWILEIKEALADEGEYISGTQSPIDEGCLIPRQAELAEQFEVEALTDMTPESSFSFTLSDQQTPKAEYPDPVR